MKKLMTMIAAVAMAFGLYAKEEYKAGTPFNDPEYVKGAFVPTTTADLTWDGATTEFTIVDADWAFDDDKYLPEQWSSEDKGFCLNVKSALNAAGLATVTPTKPIVLSVDPDTGKVTEKIYVDTLVKFTAFDEDAIIDGMGAKLAVWIMETTNEVGNVTGTNLFVTAGTIVGGELGSAKIYDCGPYTAGDWCRLTIKSMGNIAASGDFYGFVVYVNNEPVSPTETIGFDGLTLKPEVQFYKDGNILFPSLGEEEISTLGVVGQGAIDDLAFTTKAPDFAEDMLRATVTVSAEAFAKGLGTIKVSTNDFEAADLTLAGGSATIYYKKNTTRPTIKIAWTGSDTVFAGEKTMQAQESSLTIEATDVTSAVAEVTIGQTTTKYAKLTGTSGDSAIEAVNAEVGEATVKLIENNAADRMIQITKADKTLDLNGKSLSAQSPATIMANVAITITGDGSVAGPVTAPAATIESGTFAGKITVGTITGGTFDGAVTVTTISGTTCKFSVANNTDEQTGKCKLTAPAGKKWVKVDENAYWKLEALAQVTFTVNAKTNTEVTEVKVNGSVVTESPYAITEGQPYVVTFAANTGYTLSGSATVSGDAGAENFEVTGPDATAIKVTKITVGVAEEAAAEVDVGKTLQLTATVEPDDALDPSVEWLSGNTALATVDENGLVTGVAAGTVTITAKAKDGSEVTGTINLEVKSAAPVNPEIEPVNGEVTVDAPSTCKTVEDAVKWAQDNVTVKSPDTQIVSDTAYKAYFKFSAKNVEGTFEVTAELDEKAVEADDTLAEDVAAKLGDAAVAFADGNTVTIPVAKAKPGLYYAVATCATVGGTYEPGVAKQAGVDGSIEGGLVANKPTGATNAVFFKIVVTAQPAN